MVKELYILRNYASGVFLLQHGHVAARSSLYPDAFPYARLERLS